MNRLLNKAIEDGATVLVRANGVTLYINVEDEDAYIETEPGFKPESLGDKEYLLNAMGFEIIAEEPPVELGDGRVRHYAEQVYFGKRQELVLETVSEIASRLRRAVEVDLGEEVSA